ncbi:unnamed protein product [Owenia fusiformis]|uniref:Uncharacterized protein n=1 Tax=Owenia fusiformis TaxID=6347 RepID=A0A8J1TFK7_OWEFU|nr:unnamed protein product [Owenia fusiformis]
MSWFKVAVAVVLCTNTYVYSFIYNDHEYLGCFADTTDRDLNGRTNLIRRSRWDCITTCKAHGFQYSGNQNAYTCFCGNSYGRHGMVDKSECDMTCEAEGNTQTCGGAYRNNVYDTGFRMEENRVSADVAKLSSGASIECSSSTSAATCKRAIDGEIAGFCVDRLVSGDVYNVPDSAITASSVWNNDLVAFGAQRSRLDTKAAAGLCGGWASAEPHTNIWIRADLGQVMFITGIITQGRNGYSQWVTSYKFLYGKDEGSLQEYGMVLQGNSDRDTKVQNMLDPPVNARYVQINPQTKYGTAPCLRFDVIGCEIENVGAWVNVTLARSFWVKEISMIQNRESLLTQARKVKMDFSDGLTTKMDMFDMEPTDQHSWESVRFDPPVLASWVKITFIEAYVKSKEPFGIVELDIIADFGPLTNQAALIGTATSSTQFNGALYPPNAVDGTLIVNFAFQYNTWVDQWILITLDAEYWVHVIKYANRCARNSQHKKVLVELYDASSSLKLGLSVSSQVFMYFDEFECGSFRWTTLPLPYTRLVKSVKFTIEEIVNIEALEIAPGMSEIQIFTGQNLASSSAPIVQETFPSEKRQLIRTLTDMDKSVCAFEVQYVSGSRLLFYTNAIGLTQFKLVITTNGGAADDFDVFSTGDTTANVTTAKMLRCDGPEYPGTGEFTWTCTISEEGDSLYAATVLVSTSSVYQICEIELQAVSDIPE